MADDGVVACTAPGDICEASGDWKLVLCAMGILVGAAVVVVVKSPCVLYAAVLLAVIGVP